MAKTQPFNVLRRVSKLCKFNKSCLILVIHELSNVFEFQVDALTTSRGREGGSVVESVLNQVIIFFLKRLSWLYWILQP